jgi:hypothetical protein
MAYVEDIVQVFIAAITDWTTPVEHCTRGGLQSAGHQSHQRGFASAIGTLNLHNIPGINNKVGRFEDIAVVALKSELLDC